MIHSNRRQALIDDGTLEVVLAAGVEGGGGSIVRFRDGTGSWRYRVEGTSMYLDENGDDDWKSWASDPFATLEEALDRFARSGKWTLFYPIEVHPELRERIWELFVASEPLIAEHLRGRYEEVKGEWAMMCQAEDMGR